MIARGEGGESMLRPREPVSEPCLDLNLALI